MKKALLGLLIVLSVISCGKDKDTNPSNGSVIITNYNNELNGYVFEYSSYSSSPERLTGDFNCIATSQTLTITHIESQKEFAFNHASSQEAAGSEVKNYEKNIDGSIVQVLCTIYNGEITQIVISNGSGSVKLSGRLLNYNI